MLDMLIGATRELKVGDPREPATHVGPVIDAEAKDKLESWIARHGARRPLALPLGRRPGVARRRNLCGAGADRARPRRAS